MGQTGGFGNNIVADGDHEIDRGAPGGKLVKLLLRNPRGAASAGEQISA
jgi:hypothetical protein